MLPRQTNVKSNHLVGCVSLKSSSRELSVEGQVVYINNKLMDGDNKVRRNAKSNMSHTNIINPIKSRANT